jgi:transposase
MTREQKIAKARALLAAGRTFGDVAAAIGVSKRTVRRWLVPGEAERDRQRARAWKARNRSHLRDYNLRYDAEHGPPCSQCGQRRNSRRRGPLCEGCIKDGIDHRARQIEQWWAEGLKLKEIAERLGWSVGHVSMEMDRLRAKGYALPYRRRTGSKNATKFPEQAVA